MDTVVTPLTSAWSDLTAVWAAATPAAADGEAITVQPADAGSSQAIEVIQAAAEPDAGERGHLLAGGETLALTGTSGRKHYGRAYMGSASVVASGEGVAGERGGGTGGARGGGPILRDPPDEFSGANRAAAESARDMAIPDTSDFDDNPNLAIVMTITAGADAGTFYQARRGGSWVTITPIVRGPRGLPGDPGGGAGLTLIHSPAVSPAAARLAAVPGRIRGSVVLDISDLSAFTAVSAGTLTIGSETVRNIDLSAATTINEVIDALNTAIGTNATLAASYSARLSYINPNFYGEILRSSGDVEAVSGSLEPLFGWSSPAATVAHVAASPSIVLPARPGGGAWAHLMIRAIGQSYQDVYWYVQSDYWAVGGAGSSLSHYLSLLNSGGWQTQSFEADGEAIPIGVVVAYRLTYFTILYDPATRTVSWRAERDLPVSDNWSPSIDTLTVLAR